MLYLFRLITNIRFYVGILCMSLLVFALSKTDVMSFRWLPSLSVSTSMKQIDTTYISQQRIADHAVLLTYANISVGHSAGSSQGGGLQDLDGDTVSKALLSIKNLQIIRSTDVLNLKNTDGAQGLSTLMNQGQTVVSQSQALTTILQTSIAEAQSKVDACTSQKTQADEIYRQGLAANDATQIDQATKQAQESSSCISTNSVSLKSMNGVLTNLTTEIEKTQKYLTLITTNQGLIEQYAGLLSGEIPSQLVQFQKDFQAL